MRFIEDEGRVRTLELTADDLLALQRGASIGDGGRIIVSVVSPPVVRTWVMRTEHCGDCDRPELCAVIQAKSGPCGRNRYLTMIEQK